MYNLDFDLLMEHFLYFSMTTKMDLVPIWYIMMVLQRNSWKYEHESLLIFRCTCHVVIDNVYPSSNLEIFNLLTVLLTNSFL